MPMDARDRSHGIVHAQPERHGWSLQSPAKAAATASIIDAPQAAATTTSHDIPRCVSAMKDNKLTAKRSSSLPMLVQSAATLPFPSPRIWRGYLIRRLFRWDAA
jgi:hypothetical protein